MHILPQIFYKYLISLLDYTEKRERKKGSYNFSENDHWCKKILKMTMNV